jgi:hypothetical protein
MRPGIRTLLTIGCLLIAAVTLHAQNRWRLQVRNLLKQAGDVLERRGYQLSEEIYTGALSNGESESLSLELEGRAGGYAIIAVCDADCDDVDLFLSNLYGEIVSSDDEPDDTPLVTVPAGRPGVRMKYRIKVSMESCKSSPCYYGIGIFDRPR